MNRTDVDGLKGDEFNMFDGRRCLLRFRVRGHDLLAGAAEHSQRVAIQVNGGRMDGFVAGTGRRVRP